MFVKKRSKILYIYNLNLRRVLSIIMTVRRTGSRCSFFCHKTATWINSRSRKRTNLRQWSVEWSWHRTAYLATCNTQRLPHGYCHVWCRWQKHFFRILQNKKKQINVCKDKINYTEQRTTRKNYWPQNTKLVQKHFFLVPEEYYAWIIWFIAKQGGWQIVLEHVFSTVRSKYKGSYRVVPNSERTATQKADVNWVEDRSCITLFNVRFNQHNITIV